MALFSSVEKVVREAMKEVVPCKGKIFRCNKSMYTYNDRGTIIWGEKVVMRELKKKSCPGCENCGYFDDDLSDMTNDGGDLVSIRPEIEHNALYKLEVVDVTIDYESGLCDGYELAFIKVE